MKYYRSFCSWWLMQLKITFHSTLNIKTYNGHRIAYFVGGFTCKLRGLVRLIRCIMDQALAVGIVRLLRQEVLPLDAMKSLIHELRFRFVRSLLKTSHCTAPYCHDDVIKRKHFRVTGPLCGEFTGHRRIPLTKASDAELWCVLWINSWVNDRKVGDLRRHCAHYDAIVMVLGMVSNIGELKRYLITAKHNKRRTECIFPGLYCSKWGMDK